MLTRLVAAFMRLAGEANWWAPVLLRRFHDRYGFTEGEDVTDAVSSTGGASSLLHWASLSDADLSFLDLETERIRRGDGRVRQRPLVSSRS